MINFFEQHTPRTAIFIVSAAFAFFSASSALAADAGSNTKIDVSKTISEKRTTIPRAIPQPVTVPTPVLIKFLINNGATTTTRREVRLNSTAQNATHYRIAEGANAIVDSPWLPYANTVGYRLSAENGGKMIMMQVINSSQKVSNAKYDTIMLNDPQL